jgi:hypothetical protein
VRQEVPTPEITKEEVAIERAGEISAFRTPGVRRTQDRCSQTPEVPNREIPKGVREDRRQDISGFGILRDREPVECLHREVSNREIPKRRSRGIGARIFRVSAY